MKFKFGSYLLEVDVDKTREFYQSAELLTQGCQCPGCRNFVKAVEFFPDEVKQFFEQLGILPEKSVEVYVNCSEDHGRKVFYGGFCHLCGRVLEGDSPYVPVGVDHWALDLTYQIAEGYQVGFNNGGNLIEKNFPEPIVQMELEFHIPWVLEEDNEYS